MVACAMTRPVFASALVALAFVLASAHAPRAARAAGDPIADDLAHWRAYLAADTVTVGFLADVKRSVGPALASAEDALAKGRPSFALLRLGSVRTNLEPGRFAAPRSGWTATAFDAEWQKLAPRFANDDVAREAMKRKGVTPMLARAFAQSFDAQGRETYAASLAYGRATEPLYGFYYLAQGVSQLDFAEFAARAGASLRPLGAARAPVLRGLQPEIKALRAEMLAAYKPPVSIDRHPEFIGASSATKEAMEYASQGLDEAALLRYLQAAVRFAPLRADRAPLAEDVLEAKTREWTERLAESGVDHSIAQLFLDVAAGDRDTARAGHAVVASAVVEDVLPRYWAALSPAARPVAAKPAQATVTLVRWPYT